MQGLTSAQFEQLKAFDNCFIEYPEISEIYSIFEQLRFNHSLGGEPESFLLTGESGSGKTALINNYLRRFESGRGYCKQTVLSTRVPTKINEESTLKQFLVDLGSQAGGRSKRKQNAIALTEGVIRQLEQKSVELIIVNEIQELIEFTDALDRQTIANTFKSISEGAGVSFVLVGMPYAEIIANEPQWNSRLSWRRKLEYFKLFEEQRGVKDTGPKLRICANQQKHFARFVKGLASRMGYVKVPALTKDEIFYPLFTMCRGECRRLKHFLRDAMLMSFKENKQTIDKDVLRLTFEFKFPYLDNPFDVALEKLTITQLATNSVYNTSAISAEDRILAPRFTDALPLNMLLSNSRL